MQLKGGFLSFPQITFAIFTVYGTKTTHVSFSIPEHIYMIIAQFPAEHTVLKQTLNLCPGFNKTEHWLSPILFTPSNVSPDTFHRADTFNSQSRLNPPYPEQNGLSLRAAGGALAALTSTGSTLDLSGLHRRSHVGGFIVGMDLCLPAGAWRRIERDINRLTPLPPSTPLAWDIPRVNCKYLSMPQPPEHWWALT